MKQRIHGLLILFLLISFTLSGQLAPDFTITDSDGQQHTLYAGYLNQGKTVLIKIFFTTCPPCNAIAPYMQPLYEEWGSGNYDVEFFDLSDKSFDTDVLVNNYKANYGHTYPAAGSEGGSLAAVAPYKADLFGDFTGTPTFIVIAPNGTVQFDVFGFGNQGTIDAVDAAIAATGAVKPECTATASINEAYCAGDSVQVLGNWYAEPGVYFNTVPGDCDTTYTITITEDPLETKTINATFCPGESVVIYGTTYNSAGQYEVTVPSVTFGCDTIATLNITQLPINTKTINTSYAEGDSVLVNGVWYSAPGTYFYTVNSITTACDTIVTLHVTEIPDIPIEVTVTGIIRKFQSTAGVAGAYVIVSKDSVEIARDTTDANGVYSFTFDSLFAINNTLSITVGKDIGALNGVTVLDLARLQKHLLGLENLPTVEQMFAADLNNSQSVSALDVVYFRRLVLGLETMLGTPETWLFFHDSLNFGPPGPQPPVITGQDPVLVGNILNGTQNGNFRGIKIGDLNHSANPQE